MALKTNFSSHEYCVTYALLTQVIFTKLKSLTISLNVQNNIRKLAKSGAKLPLTASSNGLP